MLQITKKISTLVFFSLIFVYNCLAADKLRAGFILPLSGPSSFWGAQMRDGAVLAYEQLPDAIRSQITLEFEDDAFSAKNTVSAYRKLEQSGELDLVVVFGSSAAEALIPTVERDKVPMVVITALENVSVDKLYVFRYWLSSLGQAQSTVNELNKRKLNRIAVVVASFSALLDVEEKFKITLGESAQIVVREEIPTEMTDFRALIARILGNRPNAIYMLLLPGQISAFAKQLRTNDKNIQVFGNSTIENGNEVKAAAGSMEGIIYPGPAFSPTFIKQFNDRFGHLPEMAAGNGYDMVKIISLAVKERKLEAKQLNSFLHNLHDFSGSLGDYGVSKQNAFDVTPVTKIVENGQFKIVAKGSH
jgi:ABC-type branched-subunit amino acid transport system substrate-binding protein